MSEAIDVSRAAASFFTTMRAADKTIEAAWKDMPHDRGAAERFVDGVRAKEAAKSTPGWVTTGQKAIWVIATIVVTGAVVVCLLPGSGDVKD